MRLGFGLGLQYGQQVISGIPVGSMLWDTGSVMLWDDGTLMLWS